MDDTIRLLDELQKYAGLEGITASAANAVLRACRWAEDADKKSLMQVVCSYFLL